MAIPTDDEIRVRAYQIWKDEGQPEGMAAEHWRRASEEVSLIDGEGANAVDADLVLNPGISSSAGTSGTDPTDFEGENTFEGDVMNDVTFTGSVDPGQRGRTNK